MESSCPLRGGSREVGMTWYADYPSSGLSPHDACYVYSQQPPTVSYPHNGISMDGQGVKTRPEPFGKNVVVTAVDPFEPRPSHGFAMCTMIFAAVTFVLTFPSSLLCTFPAMIFSGLALAQDYRSEEAKTLLWISLTLTLIYYLCLVIAVIVITAEVG